MKKSVLVVEDQSNSAAIIAQKLRNTGIAFDMMHAKTLEDATKILSERFFDLIVLDLLLPDSNDGTHTFAAVRVLCNDAPVIVLTAVGDTNVKSMVTKGGAYAYLVKGQISNEEFNNAVNAAIGRNMETITSGDNQLSVEAGSRNLFARVRGADAKSVLVAIIITGCSAVLWLQAESNARLFLAQHSVGQGLQRDIIKNQGEIIRALNEAQANTQTSLKVLTYVTAQDEKGRKALNITMPDELKYGYGKSFR